MKKKFGFIAGICSLTVAVMSVVMMFTAVYFYGGVGSDGMYYLNWCVSGMTTLVHGVASQAGDFENVLVAFSWVEFLIGITLIIVNLVTIGKEKSAFTSLIVVVATAVGAGFTSLLYLVSGIVSVVIANNANIGTMAPLFFVFIWLMMVPTGVFAVIDFINKQKEAKAAKAAESVAEVA